MTPGAAIGETADDPFTRFSIYAIFLPRFVSAPAEPIPPDSGVSRSEKRVIFMRLAF
jgi:hypothetical protein